MHLFGWPGLARAPPPWPPQAPPPIGQPSTACRIAGGSANRSHPENLFGWAWTCTIGIVWLAGSAPPALVCSRVGCRCCARPTPRRSAFRSNTSLSRRTKKFSCGNSRGSPALGSLACCRSVSGPQPCLPPPALPPATPPCLLPPPRMPAAACPPLAAAPPAIRLPSAPCCQPCPPCRSPRSNGPRLPARPCGMPAPATACLPHMPCLAPAPAAQPVTPRTLPHSAKRRAAASRPACGAAWPPADVVSSSKTLRHWGFPCDPSTQY